MLGPIGGTEVALICLIILLFFGAKKLPEMARGIGESIKEMRSLSKDIDKSV